MTTLVSIENIKDLNEKVTITEKMLSSVPWDASVAGLQVGDVVTYEDLLYAVTLPFSSFSKPTHFTKYAPIRRRCY